MLDRLQETRQIAQGIVSNIECNYAVFVGAGASVSLGFPLMTGFFSKLFRGMDFYDILRKKEFFPADARGEDFLLELLFFAITETTDITEFMEGGKNPPIDLEDFITGVLSQIGVLDKLRVTDPELAKAYKFVLASDRGFKLRDRVGGAELIGGDLVETYKAKFAEAIRYIKKALYKVYSFPDEKKAIPEVKSLYHGFFSALVAKPGNTIPVFTTNYDKILDIYFDNFAGPLRVTYSSSFRVGGRYGVYNPRGLVYETQKKIHYFNLHGSISWVPSGDTVVYRPGTPVDYPGEDKDIPLAVPVISKGSQMHPVCQDMYEFFKAYVLSGRVQTLIVIGFSFRDIDIKNIIGTALETKNLNVIIIDPAFETQSPFSDSFRERVKVIPTRFDADDMLSKFQEILNQL